MATPMIHCTKCLPLAGRRTKNTVAPCLIQESLNIFHFIKKAVFLFLEGQFTRFPQVHELARRHPQGFPGVTARHPLRRRRFR